MITTTAKEFDCLRLFVQVAYSQNFETYCNSHVPVEQAHSYTKHGNIQCIWMRANEYAVAKEERKHDAIQPGGTIETTPWMQGGMESVFARTDCRNLLEIVSEPKDIDEGWDWKISQVL
ncbi:hypothetical protein LTR22_027929 [Elasticomyces elasticus]|nr:hypothetical protein LTR22_027929 [Elasticomyces elasticus]